LQVGVCHVVGGGEVQSFAFVGCADVASFEYQRPNGVANVLQVVGDDVEPSEADCARHLLANKY
jgi:hypothetical protein